MTCSVKTNHTLHNYVFSTVPLACVHIENPALHRTKPHLDSDPANCQ
jgi:hypothetical protein